MGSLVGVVFSLGCLILGTRGLLDGTTSIGLGTRTGGVGSGLFSVTLTGTRCRIFSVLSIFAGLIVGAVWLDAYPRVAQTALDELMWNAGVICAFTLFVSGIVCAVWEIVANISNRPRTEDD